MVELSLFIPVAAFCTFLTSWLIRAKEVTPVRASALVTLLIAGFFMAISLQHGNKVAPVILGATFVGMTEPHRLGYRSLTFASIIFAFTFHYILPYNPGFGGALGFAAFISSIFIYVMKKNLIRKPI